MSLQEEAYADARASQVHESFQPYVRQRLRYSNRLTAISETRRFFVLLLGAHGCICASAGYLYNLFSGNLQKKYNLTQTEMSTITTVASIIGLVAFPLASVYDYYGPRPLFVVAMITYPLGSILFALSFMDVLYGSVFRFTIYCSLQGVGTSMFDISSLMTVMTIFPSSRGAVIAVMKTFIGLGAAIFGICQIGFFENNIGLFLCAISVYVAIVGFVCLIFVTLPPYHLTGYEEKHLPLMEKFRRLSQKRTYLEQIPPFRRFAIGFVIVVMLIIILPTESALVAFAHLDNRYSKVFAISTICIMCFYSFIAAPISWLNGKVNNSSEVALQIGEANSERLNLERENVEHGFIRQSDTTNERKEHAPDEISTCDKEKIHEVMEEKKESETEKQMKHSISVEQQENICNSAQSGEKQTLTTLKLDNDDDNIENVSSNSEINKKNVMHKTQCNYVHCVQQNAVTFSSSEIARESAILSSYIANTRGSIVDEAVFTMPFLDEAEHIAPQYQTTFAQSLRTMELWVMAYSLFCMVGAQIVIIVNARFIYAAIAEKPISNEVAALLTILNGAGSAVARLLMSVFEIWTQKREPEKRIPLTIALYIPSVCLLLASASILFVPSPLLIIPFVLTAFGNGFYAASTVLVMRTVYAKDTANHYNFLSLASLLATILLNKFLYGSWYTQRAEKQNNTLCSGRDCVFLPFVVITFLLLTTLASNWFVHVRYRLFCDQILAQRQTMSSRLIVDENDGIAINDYETQPLLQHNV